MRIPLASRIPFRYAVMFTVAVFLLQQVEQTKLFFSACFAAFTLLSCVAFNVVGGFVYPSGSFIFFNATLTCIFGLTYKLFLGEPGNSNLRDPDSTMLAYCAGETAILLVAVITRRFVPRKGLLAGMGSGDSMKKAALGAFLLGAAVQMFTLGTAEAGSFLAAIRQINYFIQMAILLATFYQVRKTGGRESTNWIVWTATLWSFAFGVLSFSKQGMLTGPVTWLGAAIVAGHNFSRRQLVGVVLAGLFFQAYLVPISQIGRVYRGEEPTLASDIRLAYSFLSDLGGTRTKFLADEKESSGDFGNAVHLYNERHGLVDRLSTLSPDDALIDYTDQGDYEGTVPTVQAFLNIVPHFLWKDKPFFYTGNIYAREIGMIDENNDVTGVSFSPTADAYRQAGYWGVFLILPAIILLLFFVMDGLSGDVRRSPWGLLFAVSCAHTANEGMLGGQVYLATYVAFGVVVVALLSKYLLPIVSGVLTNTERTRVIRTRDFKPKHLRDAEAHARSLR